MYVEAKKDKDGKITFTAVIEEDGQSRAELVQAIDILMKHNIEFGNHLYRALQIAQIKLGQDEFAYSQGPSMMEVGARRWILEKAAPYAFEQFGPDRGYQWLYDKLMEGTVDGVGKEGER